MIPAFLIAAALLVGPAAGPAAEFDHIQAELAAHARLASAIVPGLDVERVLGPHEAVRLALADLTQLPGEVHPFVRYVWIPAADREVQALVNDTANEVWSRSEVLVRPVVLFGGHLLRYDLRELAPVGEDFLDIAFLWADLAVEDRVFHLALDGVKVVEVRPFWHAGERCQQRSLRLAAPHPYLGLAGETLAELVGSQGAIYRADWLLEKSNTTTNGGRYYDFRGIQLSAPKGKSPLDLYLEKRGISRAELDALKLQEQAILLSSAVTNKVRVIVAATEKFVRPSRGAMPIMVTLDVDSNQVDVANDPIRNVLGLRFAVYEIIAVTPNGCHEYVIANKAGEILTSGGVEVTPDPKEPAHSSRKSLQCRLSCVRCHNSNNGYNPFKSDIAVLLEDDGLNTIAIFDDLKSKKGVHETLHDFARLFSSDLNAVPLGPLTIGRQYYAATIAKTTLGLTPAKVGAAYDRVHREYFVELVGARTALAECGFLVKDDAAGAQLLAALLPRPAPNVDGSSPEDPVLAALMKHRTRTLRVQRSQFDLVFPDLMTRFYGRLAETAAAIPQEQM